MQNFKKKICMPAKLLPVQNWGKMEVGSHLIFLGSQLGFQHGYDKYDHDPCMTTA